MKKWTALKLARILIAISLLSPVLLALGEARLSVNDKGDQINAAADLIGAIITSAFDPNVLYCGGYDHTVRKLDLISGKSNRLITLKHSVLAMTLFENDAKLAISGAGTEIVILDSNNGKQEYTLTGHTRWIDCLIGLDRHTIASASSDGTLSLWDLSKERKRRILRTQKKEFSALATDKSKHLFVSADDAGRIVVWDFPGGTKKSEIQGHDCPIGSIALSPQGTRLVSGGENGDIFVWNPTTMQRIRKLDGHKENVLCLDVSEKKMIASGSADKTARIWDMETGKNLFVLKHSGFVKSLRFLKNDSQLVTGTNDNTLAFWDLSDGSKLKELRLPKAR